MIELKGFGKDYGAFTAVENLDLKIEEGEMFGFIGPNGAGKSTSIRFLATLLRAMELVDTADPSELSSSLTPLTDGASPWRHSAREILALLAFRQGDRDKAREQYKTLAEDADAPAGIRGRARDMLSVIGG